MNLTVSLLEISDKLLNLGACRTSFGKQIAISGLLGEKAESRYDEYEWSLVGRQMHLRTIHNATH